MTEPVSDRPPHQNRQRPALLVFDVNETLSDMAPMAERFEDVGAPGQLARTWFAALLRDGFALTAAGTAAPFARIGEETLRTALEPLGLRESLEDSVAHVMRGFGELRVHEDVADGVRLLSELGIRLVTLSNGSASVAERLLDEAGLRHHFEALLSVEEAGVWKPARAAYAYALDRCGVQPAEAMLVAVHPWDTDGARRTGLATAWLNRTGGSYPGHFLAPELTCRSLPDLAEQLH